MIAPIARRAFDDARRGAQPKSLGVLGGYFSVGGCEVLTQPSRSLARGPYIAGRSLFSGALLIAAIHGFRTFAGRSLFHGALLILPYISYYGLDDSAVPIVAKECANTVRVSRLSDYTFVLRIVLFILALASLRSEQATNR